MMNAEQLREKIDRLEQQIDRTNRNVIRTRGTRIAQKRPAPSAAETRLLAQLGRMRTELNDTYNYLADFYLIGSEED